MEKNEKIKDAEIVEDEKEKEEKQEEKEVKKKKEVKKEEKEEYNFEEELKVKDEYDFHTKPEYKETPKEKPKKKNGAVTAIIVLTVLLFIVLIVGSLLIALNNTGVLKFETPTINKKKAVLNYTETTSSAKSDGVHIIDVSDVVDAAMPSIVAITSKTLISTGSYGPSYFFGNSGNTQQYAEGAGSGIIISQTDDEILILTNHHVIEGAEELSVQFVNEKSVDATVKGTSEKKDVAVIAVKIKDLDNDTLKAIKIATIGDSTKLKPGEGVIAIGNALGYGQSVTAGIVSAVNRDVKSEEGTKKMIQMDAAINGGNSGGALLNNAGEVVGICEAKYSNYSSSSGLTEGMSLAIPVSDVKDTIEKLMNGEDEKSEDVRIGIEGYMISEQQAKYNNCPVGFYISKIEDGMGADKAGLEIGNIITEIDGTKVSSINDISNVLYDKKKGDKVKLKVSYANRNSYKEKEVEVTLS